jgi:membrane fusion protein (multidrug efflux system)
VSVRVVVSMVALIATLCPEGASAEPPASVRVETQPLARHDLTETLQAYGRVEPAPDQVIAVALPRAGIIEHLWVSLGERIQAGQPLIEVATSPNEQMSYEQAKAAVGFAESKLSRQEHLFQQHLATRDQVDAARQELDDARSTLQALERRGADRKTQVIRAPVAGIVAKVDVTQGDRVQADTGALLLATGRALVVPLGLEPEDARRVASGMPVLLTSAFQPSLHVEAQVGAVHAMVNPSTRLVDAVVAVPDAATSELMLGSAIEGTITLETRNALAVPRRAVLTDAKGPHLFVVEQGHARRVDVSTGLEDGGLLEVSGSGLHAGQKVVTLGNYELSDGAMVRESPR